MPRFPVTFRRKSAVLDEQNGPVEPSFRVLDRSEVGHGNGKSFDGGAKMRAAVTMPRTAATDVPPEDNLFAGMKVNRESGSSNTTKAASDNSSRHSNTSTAPSSTDYPHDDLKATKRKPVALTDQNTSPTSTQKSPGGFLKNAGRTFSFGSKKTSLPPIPASEQHPVPAVPDKFVPETPGGRSRAHTGSTITTTTPPKVEDRDFMLDLGSDLSNMLSAFNKRVSVATVKDDGNRPVASRNLTGNRANQPSPLHLDRSSKIEPPAHSWTSQNSNDGLLDARKNLLSPTLDKPPPPVPKHGSTPSPRLRPAKNEEEVSFLKDSMAASRFLAGSGEPDTRGLRGDEDTLSSLRPSYTMPTRMEAKTDEDNMFDTPRGRATRALRPINRTQTQPQPQAQNKVMNQSEFERYRQDKARQSMVNPDKDESDNEEEPYEDDEDDAEKSKKLAKQRRQQEAHMTVYRQQMMKVTGEQGGMPNLGASRLSVPMSFSTPNLHAPMNGKGPTGSNSPLSDPSDDDEEVPLAILAAHGFPNKNRPPTRLSTVGSNPNLRASIVPSYSLGGGAEPSAQAANSGGKLPAFARKLPQDPFLGAGLVNQAPRESIMMGGGAPAGGANRALPPGGLVGVIANEERQRAMRRGSPNIESAKNGLANQMQMGAGGFDPTAGFPQQMMYPGAMPQMPMLTPGDHAQMQMNQQMQQFMQMQMQFMQMMAGQNQGQGMHPMGHMSNQSMGSLHDMQRNSFLGDPMMMGMGNPMGGLDPSRGDAHMRTMSMVQPSSASWVQPPQPGYAPSIRIQGAGYAPSIAPSERSNIGLPGRYRPVSSMNPLDTASRTHTMSGAIPNLSKLQFQTKVTPTSKDDDEDDEQGWEAMKAKREKKKGLWRTKKTLGPDISGELIS